MNPMDEKGFGRNCDNSERYGIRCIGEDLIVMTPDVLVRTCFKSVCTIQSISLQATPIWQAEAEAMAVAVEMNSCV